MILVSSKDKSQEQISEVMSHVWKEYIGRIIGNKNQVVEWFQFINDNILSDQMDFPDFDSIYQHGYTIMETKKAIEKTIRELKFTHGSNLEVKLDIEKLKKAFNGGNVGNLTWGALKVFTNSIGYEITDENIFQYVVHCLIHSGSAERMEQILTFEESKKWVIDELIGISMAKIKEQIVNEYKIKASDKYFESFGFEHQSIYPMTKEQILSEAIELGIDVNFDTFDSIYTFNPDNKLLANACMAKDCPYYLHPRKDFSAHIERMKTNPNFVHSYHRAICMGKNKPINKIIDNISDGSCRPGQYQFVPLPISKSLIIEKYLGDIEILKDIYQSIYSN
jgi:hypothetical protein